MANPWDNDIVLGDAKDAGSAKSVPWANDIVVGKGEQGGQKEFTPYDAMMSDLRGIPLLGHLFPETEGGKVYEKEHPVMSGINRGVAGTLATAPLFAAAPGFASGVGLNAALSAGDTALEGGGVKDIAESAGLGAGFGALAHGAGKLLGKAITPGSPSAEHQAATQVLKDAGVPLTAALKTGSESARYAEDVAANTLGKGQQFFEPTKRGFTEAVMEKTGQRSLAGPQEVQSMLDRIGQGFEQTGARNFVDRAEIPQLTNEINGVVTRYTQMMPKSQQIDQISNMAGDIQRAAGQNGGVIPGTQYNSYRSAMSSKAAMQSDPRNAEAMRGITQALDDAMERSIARNNKTDAGVFPQLRQQWRNGLAVADAVSKAGVDAQSGFITPQALRTAVAGQEGSLGYASGRGDLNDLARAGSIVMSKLPQSGTAPRAEQMSHNALATILGAENMGKVAGGGALGYGAGAYSGQENPWGSAAIGAGAGMLGSKALSILHALTRVSGPGQAYWGNQILSPQAKAIVNALVKSRAAPVASSIEESRMSNEQKR